MTTAFQAALVYIQQRVLHVLDKTKDITLHEVGRECGVKTLVMRSGLQCQCCANTQLHLMATPQLQENTCHSQAMIQPEFGSRDPG